MGSKETRHILGHVYIDRLVIVALSAQPPGVNELCVCTLDRTHTTILASVPRLVLVLES